MLSNKELACPQPAGLDSLRKPLDSLFRKIENSTTSTDSSRSRYLCLPHIYHSRPYAKTLLIHHKPQACKPPTYRPASQHTLEARYGLPLLLIALAAVSLAQSGKSNKNHAQQRAGGEGYILPPRQHSSKNPFAKVENQVHSSINDLRKPYNHMFNSAVGNSSKA